MQLPPEQPNEPEWLQVQRGVRKEERNWNYGGLAAIPAAMLPYALIDAILPPAHVGAALLATSAAVLAAAIIVLRRTPRGTFKRGFVIWSVPVHALATVLFTAMLLR